MQRLLLAIGLGIFVTVAAQVPAYGQYRNDPYSRDAGRDGYGRPVEGGAGYGGGIVERTMSDLSRVGGYDRHEWKHVDHAQRELGKFQEKWARGKFDTHPLDEAIDELKHLAYSARLSPRDSGLLGRDIQALRNFRESRGYGGYRDGYRGRGYDPGYRP